MSPVTPPRIAIFSDNTGWHEKRLLRAFARRNADARVVSLRDCRFGAAAKSGMFLPGFEDTLPEAAMVRAVPDGTFEEVSFRLDILHALGDLGCVVYNPARAIERTVDKAMTSQLLGRFDIPTPPYWVCESEDAARAIAAGEMRAGHRLVQKPLFGNCGRGLLLVDAPDRLPPREQVEGIYYLQRFVEQPGPGGRDWRVFVISGQAVAAMERVSGNWITNRARGGQCLPAVLTEELRDLAERSAAATGTFYTGVDIIRDADGRYLVLEVNGVPAWRGLQSVHPVDIAELLADDLLRRLNTDRQSSAARQARDGNRR
ncbi:MAG: RimK family alpha-L-glutamate ligase [Gammaproteobacteria bacterium]|nr:RimK family alpha-L-glutamate ligase [Gammaproteobacteria bacterium]